MGGSLTHDDKGKEGDGERERDGEREMGRVNLSVCVFPFLCVIQLGYCHIGQENGEESFGISGRFHS